MLLSLKTHFIFEVYIGACNDEAGAGGVGCGGRSSGSVPAHWQPQDQHRTGHEVVCLHRPWHMHHRFAFHLFFVYVASWPDMNLWVLWCFVHVCFVQVTILKLVWPSQCADMPRCMHFPTDICSVIQEGEK